MFDEDRPRLRPWSLDRMTKIGWAHVHGTLASDRVDVPMCLLEPDT